MGANAKFFQELREGEEYANVFVTIDVLNQLKVAFYEDKDYQFNFIKEKNSLYDTDEILKARRKDYMKVKNEITKREQELNHINKNK